MNDVNFSQVMERMGRRRLQNGNFAITLFNVRCFLLTCLHGPDCNWCAIAGQASYGMCLWRRLFHWPQGCLGYMAKPVNLAVAVSLSTSCLVFFFCFLEFQERPNKMIYTMVQKQPLNSFYWVLWSLICAIIWAWFWGKPSLLAILDATEARQLPSSCVNQHFRNDWKHTSLPAGF